MKEQIKKEVIEETNILYCTLCDTRVTKDCIKNHPTDCSISGDENELIELTFQKTAEKILEDIENRIIAYLGCYKENDKRAKEDLKYIKRELENLKKEYGVEK